MINFRRYYDDLSKWDKIEIFEEIGLFLRENKPLKEWTVETLQKAIWFKEVSLIPLADEVIKNPRKQIEYDQERKLILDLQREWLDRQG